jgi:hypothetical protein
MAERTPGGLFHVDSETREELLRPAVRPPFAKPREIPSFSTGRRINVKLASEYFVTDPEAWLVELHDPALVLTTGEVTVEAAIPLLEEAARAARAVAIGAPQIGEELLLFLIANNLRGTLFCAAFELDVYGLDNLARFAGGAGALATIQGCRLDELPHARRVVLSPDGLSIEPREA